MNAETKYPKDKGKPIRVKKAKSEQARWKKNPKNKKYPSDTFPVPVDILSKCIADQECHGVNFCNGLDNDDNYTPVMSVVNGEGEILSAFDTTEEISIDDFKNARVNWNEKFPLADGDSQLFYLGEEAIKTNIEHFEVTRYEAAFVEKTDGADSAVLYGYYLDGMKDPGDDDPDTALNDSYFCPPRCEEI